MRLERVAGARDLTGSTKQGASNANLWSDGARRYQGAHRARLQRGQGAGSRSGGQALNAEELADAIADGAKIETAIDVEPELPIPKATGEAPDPAAKAN